MYNRSMKKLSFVVLLKLVPETMENIKTFGLLVLEDESDIELGYFTVYGHTKNIEKFQLFLNN